MCVHNQYGKLMGVVHNRFCKSHETRNEHAQNCPAEMALRHQGPNVQQLFSRPVCDTRHQNLFSHLDKVVSSFCRCQTNFPDCFATQDQSKTMPKAHPPEYQANEPAFIRRMREGNAALDGRHNVQLPRARGGVGKNTRLNMHGEEGEDDPIVIDESGNIISKDHVEALKKPNNEKEKFDSGKSEHFEEEAQPSVQAASVSSGFGKKRKAAKIVGEDLHNPNEAEGAIEVKSLKESTRELEGVVTANKQDAKNDSEKSVTAKKKKKKIKLAFDEED